MRVIVIGGGVAGLATAWELVQRTEAPDADVETRGSTPLPAQASPTQPAGASGGEPLEVVLLEASDRVGGKLRGESLCGVAVDVGAEAMLNRRPEGVDLARAAGLEVVHPSGAGSHLWTGEHVVPLPRTLMGVPLDVAALRASGVLSEAAMRRVEREPMLPPMHLEGDLSVGDLIAARFGDEVTDLLVEPLLGGVYAGHAREISAACAAPQLLALAAQGSMLEAARGFGATAQSTAEAPGHQAPVFAAVSGGMHRLPEALRARLEASGRCTVHTSTSVDELRRENDEFVVTVTGTGGQEDREWRADAVVVALPSHTAGHLLSDVAPQASAELQFFEAASVGVVSFAFDAEQALGSSTVGEKGSGFLVPPVAGRGIKAATFSFAKWDHVREAGRGAGPDGADVLFLRASVARLREDDVLRLRDQDLVEMARGELAAAVGLEADPLATHVQRWWAGLPQYPVGHGGRVERVRAAVAAVPGLAVAGASYDGVGIPATISSARRAVAQVLPGTMTP